MTSFGSSAAISTETDGRAETAFREMAVRPSSIIDEPRVREGFPISASDIEELPAGGAWSPKLDRLGAVHRVPAMPSNEVPAVVIGHREGFIRLNCHAPSGVVELDIPTELVPQQSRHYGATLAVRLDRNLGYRRFVVEARIPSKDFEDEPELRALREQLASDDA